ncbi:serine/threonine-protein kinase [Kitasatospora sp. NPDC056446]|uniref:serine/threonine-protein kinase n=1 Tax=Kitasatospora sp. NPDC056446 TaxID=3345819 RepID=UPI0036B19A9B
MRRILAGRYELRERLGRGGMGDAWSAYDSVLDREVVVRLVRTDHDDLGTARFFRAARAVGALSHPGVATVLDSGLDEGGSLFLVMERIHGRPLQQVLYEDGAPSVGAAVEWAAQIADALATAHRIGLVHRDLKPANIMLTDTGSVKVLDFGIALPAGRDLSGGTGTSVGVGVGVGADVIGTPGYMPPESFTGGGQDGRADLYALGCVLYQLLTGKPPFSGRSVVELMAAHLRRVPDPPSASRPEVPAALDALVAELLAKDPRDRPADAGTVRDRLRAITAALSGPPRVLSAVLALSAPPALSAASAAPAPGGPERPPDPPLNANGEAAVAAVAGDSLAHALARLFIRLGPPPEALRPDRAPAGTGDGGMGQ